MNSSLTDYNMPLDRPLNDVAAFLGKEPAAFTRHDLARYVDARGIRMVNFMYPAADARLKTLNFVIHSRAYLESILSLGERVDGSSLFPFIEAGNSDLYVIPRYDTAFPDPFAPVPTLTLLCSYYDKDGNELALAPDTTLRRACRALTDATGLELEAMAELEYYVITDDDGRFPAADQRGYHESAPFARGNAFRQRCMAIIASLGGQIKYGHSEVGNFTLDGRIYEQNEIEFLPVPALQAADQLMLAKWVIRNLAAQEGLDVTFAPKITAGKAGSGMHIHMRLMRDGVSAMTNADGTLSDDALRGIAGLMELAPAITAFGNTVPTSYLRLVPHQEAPTSVCWGDRNRSVLVRVPLGWTAAANMAAALNGDAADVPCGPRSDPRAKQTVEIRSADASADIYLLLASLAVALRRGHELEDALQRTRDTYVDVNIHTEAGSRRLATLASLPAGCHASADALERVRQLFEACDVFHPRTIDGILTRLRAHITDEELRQADALDLVKRHFHCG